MDVILETKGRCGLITLNRPQALNALTTEMIVETDKALMSWAKDPNIDMVLIQGVGGKAFCAGGDIKTLATATPDLGKQFFRAEYTLNYHIKTFPKPYVALIDGVVMGGGMGVSAHGSHRVVTENVLFAMPEANIGLFPDVGGGYFLPRAIGQTGLYIAMACKRLKAYDARYIGYATHVVKTLPTEEILAAPKHLDEILKRHAHEPASVPEIEPHRAQIDACFSKNSVVEILAALEKDGSPWAQETHRILKTMSPSSLAIALYQIRRGASMEFADVMKMEYVLAQLCLSRPDFREGVRAAIIDKDKNPQWSPAITREEIDSYFQSNADYLEL